MATCLVDLEDVLTVGEIVVRIERAYARRLKGPVRRTVETLLRTWNIGLSLGAGGFAVPLQRAPQTPADAVLLRLLELPQELRRRDGTRSVIVFDEIQDVVAVAGADGENRSVIQHQLDSASYAFAGSAPKAMEQLFADPRRPLLEQAVGEILEPLPLDEVADHAERRFAKGGRDPGAALDPLVEFARGHPMRSMMLAHFLWARTPHDTTATEAEWLAAQRAALRHASPAMRAIWKALSLNESRVALALANLGSPHVADHAAAVGLNPNSARGALEGLRDRADVIDTGAGPRSTDPLFELWLTERGVVPGGSSSELGDAS